LVGQAQAKACVLLVIGDWRWRIAGRPKRSKTAVDVVVVERSHCPKSGSARRSEYWGRMVQKCPGLRADGTPYTAIIRRRCRCLDCGQVRIDKEYV